MSDHLVLKALMDKGAYSSLKDYVPADMLDNVSVSLLKYYGDYFVKFPHRFEIDPKEFETFLKLRTKKLEEEDRTLLFVQFRKVQKIPTNKDTQDSVINLLSDLRLSGEAGSVLARYNRGEEIDIKYELSCIVEDAVRSEKNSTANDFLTLDMDEYIDALENNKGLKFTRVKLLADTIRAMDVGTSILVAARPDKGKTSFIADMLADFAPQCLEMYGSDRPLLWLNNEGPGTRIYPRLYSAVLRKSTRELIQMHKEGTLIDAYTAVLGGDQYFIRVKDVHGANMAQMERVVAAMRPSVLVADMLANFSLPRRGDFTETALLEKKAQIFREILVKYGCVGAFTMQISAEGANEFYPKFSALKDTKTGVQGAMDIAIILGSKEEKGLEYIRGLSTPKNKFKYPDKSGYAMGEVQFNPDTCEFISM